MKHVKQTLIATLITGGIIGGASLAIADDDKAEYQELAKAQIQLNDAVKIATNEVSGKVYEAELELEDNIPVWEIEILSANNELYEIEIDATSGKILSKELEDDYKA